MGVEFAVTGPPGTGKTTSLSRKIARDVAKVGPDQVIVASFTRAGAQAIVQKIQAVVGDLGMPNGNIATLHSMGNRSLSAPPLAETRKGIKGWNAFCVESKRPRWRMTVPKAEPKHSKSAEEADVETAVSDEPAWDAVRHDLPGDVLFAEISKKRAQMILLDDPRWRGEEKGMALLWERYKQETSMIDFADMIELPRTRELPPPHHASIGIFDECQDNTEADQALIRWWGSQMEEITLAGDPAQALYDWRGGHGARVFLDHPVPEGRHYVLPQSYRVPRHSRTVGRHSPPHGSAGRP